jgi:predicted phage-related endonuclease
MKIIECVQGTPEWFAARCGIPSASNFDKIVCSDGKPSKQRTKYMYQLAGESISGIQEETYQNGAMIRAKEMESEARKLYELVKGEPVQEVGFCLEEGAGASPDGLIGTEGTLELKCPIISTHVDYLLRNELPVDYFQQVQGQLAITGRKWADFMSYYPGLKPLIVRVERDETFIETLKNELNKFNEELRTITERIR